MIRIQRRDLPADLVARLTLKESELKTDFSVARRLWKSSREIRKLLRSHLALMAAGREYCMYCGDGIGSDIDHHEPISYNPARTFDWLNHLLACTFCNSHYKRDQYPIDDVGQSLLIDPTAEDPLEHLFLVLSIGRYRGLTVKGWRTILVCQLNRPLLERGRQLAFSQVSYAVNAWCEARESGDQEAQARALWTLRDQPHGDVLHAMLRQVGLPGAQDIFGDDRLISRLRSTDLRATLLK